MANKKYHEFEEAEDVNNDDLILIGNPVNGALKKAPIFKVGPSQPVTLPQGINTWLAPANTLIDKIRFTNELAAMSISIGSAEGGDDLMTATEVAPINNRAILTTDIDISVPTPIFINGITENTILTIFRR